LDDRHRYRITIGREVENSVPRQTIKVDPDVTRAVIELRVTLKEPDEPLMLPNVFQGSKPLIVEQEA
jgi:hypothetical protein